MSNEVQMLRVGILGCGPIAQFAHLESAQKARNVVLHAVCDADESLAQRFGAFYDAGRIYLDYDEMLGDPQLDAVIIATADAFHVPAALKALAAGTPGAEGPRKRTRLPSGPHASVRLWR